MKRTAANMIVDAMSLMVFCVMISTGLIMKYILPPGSGRPEMLLAGQGRGHRTIEMYLGFTRHQWGEVHFWVSVVFLCFLIIHIVLHWPWIKSIVFGLPGHPAARKRKIIFFIIVAFILISVIFPFLLPTETLSRPEFVDRFGQ